MDDIMNDIKKLSLKVDDIRAKHRAKPTLANSIPLQAQRILNSKSSGRLATRKGNRESGKQRS